MWVLAWHGGFREENAARAHRGAPGVGGDGQGAPEDPWWDKKKIEIGAAVLELGGGPKNRLA